MMRKLKRFRDFDVSLQIKNDQFIRPPREAQRNWLVNQALAEFTDNLVQLDKIAAKFVPGVESMPLVDRTQAVLDDDNKIMEDWQIPLMKAMAEIVTESHGKILEVGFGRGISATFIQEFGVKSHTIIECNDSVVARYHNWKKKYPDQTIRLIHGTWQDVVDRLESYDGIFFHTYPLNENEFLDQAIKSVTFSEHFFPTAANHLKPGGVFTYLTNEIDSISRAHQRLIFKYFSSFALKVIEPLNLPSNVKDAWWANSMTVIKVVK